jgi:hypothetical protein
MKKIMFLVAVVLIVLVANLSCQRNDAWQPLFNGQDLSEWDMFLGSSLGANFDHLAESATIEKVFSVIDDDGVGVIRISGEINGSLATRESFENYHLRLVFRWGDEVYSRRNSGLLYHSFGEFGTAIGTWMPNIEFQLMHQNLGDTYLMVNTACETAAVKDEERNQFFYTPGVELVAFGAHANGRSIKKSQDAENPLGEWNTVDLYCYGRTAVHVVNGVTVMVNNNTGVFNEGIIEPLTSGKIQLQSEGAELFIRSIDVRPIDGLPDGIL